MVYVIDGRPEILEANEEIQSQYAYIKVQFISSKSKLVATNPSLLKYNQGDKNRLHQCNLALGYYLNTVLGFYLTPAEFTKLNLI